MRLGGLAVLEEQHDVVVTWRGDRLRAARLRKTDLATVAQLVSLPASAELETLVLDLRTRQGDWPKEHTAALGLLAGLARTAPSSLRTLYCLTSSAWGVFDGLAEIEAALRERCPSLSGATLRSARPAFVHVVAAGEPAVFSHALKTRVEAGARLALPDRLSCSLPDPVLGDDREPVAWQEDRIYGHDGDRRLEVTVNGRQLPARLRTTTGTPLPTRDAPVRPGDVVALASGFRAELAEEELDVRLTRFVRPLADKRDPIESTEIYAQAIEALGSALQLPRTGPARRGRVHEDWRHHRELLRARFDITWRSPQSFNPGVMYD